MRFAYYGNFWFGATTVFVSQLFIARLFLRGSATDFDEQESNVCSGQRAKVQ